MIDVMVQTNADHCSGEPGGCGFCPDAVPGLAGDRGSQGYRGRPGVSEEMEITMFN
jgi:hypothetical protein